MINGFKRGNYYLVVVPLLSECNRTLPNPVRSSSKEETLMPRKSLRVTTPIRQRDFQ
jgi:hypothetical protein